MRRALSKQLKNAFLRTGVEGFLRRIFPSRCPVIVRYHSVSQGNSLISDGIMVSPEVFEQQVRYFGKHFASITMDKLIDCVQNRKPFPENAIVFTFDDGYRDNYQAARTLKKYGMTGVFYITAGCIESDERFWVAEIHHLLETTRKDGVRLQTAKGLFETSISEDRADSIRRLTRMIKTVDVRTREYVREELRKQLNDVPPFPKNLMLTWGQLGEMVAMGMEIGGHTMTHCNLPSATEEEAWSEISQCKALLERVLDVEVKHFAYPNGGSSQYYTPRIQELVRWAGYRSAVTSKLGAVDLSSDPFELRRVRTTERLSEVLWEIGETRVQATRA